MAEPLLTVELKYERPLALADVTTSLNALAKEYSQWLAMSDTSAVSNGVELYVESMRSGSIITNLTAMAPLALPFIENTMTVVEFAKFLKVSATALLGRRRSVAELPRHTYENWCDIVEPVAKDGGSQLNVSTVINGDVNIHLHVGTVEANAIQNTARRHLAADKIAATGIHDSAVLYLYQARYDPKSNAGDRGVIESISPDPVRLIFASDGLKSAVLTARDNPFKHAYVVDVQVETIKGRPILYRVLAIHDVIDRPEAA
jgi:hypothetical protein